MTREEAIAFFKDMNECTYGNLEEVDMAIKALEYDDAKYHEEHGEVVVDKAVWEDAKRALEQEPKTGQWIHTDDCDEEWQYRCSNCDMPSKSNGHRYCSKCGADMYPLFKKMRDATPEEQEAVDKYIKSISKPTGVNFWDLADGEYISRTELLKAIDTWDKFGCDADTKLVPYQDHYIPYIHYDDVVKCIKGMPSVKPQGTGHCEDCNHFRKLPYHADTLGKCVNHWGFCPKGDWYCADFEPQKERVNNG